MVYKRRDLLASSRCRQFECGGNGGGKGTTKKLVRIIERPPLFNLTQPPNPFKILNFFESAELIDEHNAREKFLLYYLNNPPNVIINPSSNNEVEDIRDKCNNLRIQLLAGGVGGGNNIINGDNQRSSSTFMQNSGVLGGYNFIKTKLNSYGNSNNGTYLRTTNTSSFARGDNTASTTSSSSTSNSFHHSSNLFSSFLYTFSILFVLFIVLFVIYLYYSRYIFLYKIETKLIRSFSGTCSDQKTCFIRFKMVFTNLKLDFFNFFCLNEKIDDYLSTKI